jgi:serine/threonine kinase 16
MSYLFDALSSLLSCCFPDPSIKLNTRSFKILRLLGEGYNP